jgi:hypothetical protein
LCDANLKKKMAEDRLQIHVWQIRLFQNCWMTW